MDENIEHDAAIQQQEHLQQEVEQPSPVDSLSSNQSFENIDVEEKTGSSLPEFDEAGDHLVDSLEVDKPEHSEQPLTTGEDMPEYTEPVSEEQTASVDPLVDLMSEGTSDVQNAEKSSYEPSEKPFILMDEPVMQPSDELFSALDVKQEPEELAKQEFEEEPLKQEPQDEPVVTSQPEAAVNDSPMFEPNLEASIEPHPPAEEPFSHEEMNIPTSVEEDVADTLEEKVAPVVETKEAPEMKRVDAEVTDAVEAISEAVSSSTTPKDKCCWYNTDNLDPRFVDLIYWRNIKKSAICAGSGFLTLLVFKYFPFFLVLTYVAFAILTVTVSYYVYKKTLQSVQKTDDGHPFKEHFGKDVHISTDKVRHWADVAVSHINPILTDLRRIFLVEQFADTVKFAVFLWLMTYIAHWFDASTLLIVAFIALFTIPKIYETHKEKIDMYMEKAEAQAKEAIKKIKEKLPIGKKEKTN